MSSLTSCHSLAIIVAVEDSDKIDLYLTRGKIMRAVGSAGVRE